MLLTVRMGSAVAATEIADACMVTVILLPYPSPLREGRRGRRPRPGGALLHPTGSLRSLPFPDTQGGMKVSARLVAGLCALRPAGVGADIVFRRRFNQRIDLLLDGVDPVGCLDVLGAVPLRQESRVMAVMIGARHLHRSGESLCADLLEPRRRDDERLEATPHVLAVDLLLAGDLLRVADRLRDDDRVEHAAVVEG